MKSCGLACAAFLLAANMSSAFACTQGESEDKVREAIYAAIDMRARNSAKAETAQKRIDLALDEALKRSTNPQVATDKLCKTLDDILAELRR